MIKKLSLCVIAVCATSLSKAACVANGALETARWIQSKQRLFYAQTDMTPKSKKAFLSQELFALLKRDWDCQNKEEGICAIDADPWTDAQDGGELPPIKFDLVSSDSIKARVRMRYQFGWTEADAPKPEPAQTFLLLVKDTKTNCWLLDDLIGRSSTDSFSLKENLRTGLESIDSK
jgi:hypothetical protein